MKQIVIAVALLLSMLGGSAYGQTRACDRAVSFKHIVATGPVELIPAVPNKRIYFCGFTITQKGNTLDLIVMVGNGTNCGTNTVNLTPQLELPTDLAFTSRQQTVGVASNLGVALCVQTLGSNGKLAGIVYYAQF